MKWAQALAAMGSCFGLVGPHQNGTAKSWAHGSHRMNINENKCV